MRWAPALATGLLTLVVAGLDTSRASRPAVGTAASVRRPDSVTLVGQVDGGNGHSGVRSPDLHFGLGDAANATVRLAWRDPTGRLRDTELELRPGWHTVYLAWSRGGTR